ncbi:MAG: hypothetical protein AAFV80_00775 [Bacteroidota bacterium]
MEQLIRHILVVLLLMFFVGVFLFRVERDPKQAYYFVREDCYSHGNWIQQRLFEQSLPVDVAFLGTSVSIHAVYDSLIQQSLNSLLPQDSALEVVNFGYCRPGMDLKYAFLQDIFTTKAPKLVVLELPMQSNAASHPIFPNLAEAKDILRPNQLNKDYPKNVLTAAQTRLSWFRQRFWKSNNYQFYRKYHTAYGFGTGQLERSVETLQEIQEKREATTIRPGSYQKTDQANIRAIQKLCTANNAKLVIWYGKTLGHHMHTPDNFEFVKDRFDYFVPPDSVFTNYSNLMDEDHLNTKGAEALIPFFRDLIFSSLSE